MFWGLIMEPHKRYTQTVKRAFHVSMAALDITNSDNEPTQVLCMSEDRNYLLCTLQKDKVMQCPLELTFEAGDKISFAANGNSHVHLTGYLTDEFDDLGEEEEEEEDMLQDLEVLEAEVERPAKSKKRTQKSLDGPAGKKLKTAELLDAINSHSEDSDDDTFPNLEELEEEEDDDDGEEEEDDVEDEDSSTEELEDSDEDDDNDDEEDEDDESDEDDEVEEQPQISKKKQKLLNGTSTPGKKTNNVQAKIPTKKSEEVNKTPKQEKAKTPNEKKAKQPEQKTPKSTKDTPKKRTVEGGVVIEDLKQGEGQVAKPGKICQVYYEGRLKSNNKMFDSTNKGPGFKFRLGKQEVIKGWDVGINGMKVGGKRRIICPANMAYGPKGSPPAIPPNATLVFDVELKGVV